MLNLIGRVSTHTTNDSCINGTNGLKTRKFIFLLFRYGRGQQGIHQVRLG